MPNVFDVSLTVLSASLLATAVSLTDASAAEATDRYVCYVSLSEENRIAAYEVDMPTGALKLLGHVELDGAPGSLALAPQQRLLYAAVRSTKKVATLSVDPTGKLTLVKATPIIDGPVYLTPDRTGTFLLTTYYGSHKIAVYPIEKDGTVSEKPTQILNADKNPHCIQIDRSNKFVFVPNTGADKILQFTFDLTTGLLAPNAVPEVTTAKDTGPRHLFFHPSRNFVYVCNEKGSSVTAFKFDPAAGTLTEIDTYTTLPADFKAGNSTADVEMTPNGKFLYVSNRGHDSLAGFAVDADSGRLTPLGQTPTEQTPREFNIDPTGEFLFAAGQGNGKLAAYRIDQATGKLNRLATYDVGKSPAWVLVVRLPAK